MSAVQAWQSINREDTQHLVMSMSHRLQTIIVCKRYAAKYFACTSHG
uniref:Uncharacterized protein n=1 Tax=Anguilla anguilla TaxID=7936 RepID=A0A0E9U6X6_ANGAN